jgi:hypothetical protein
MVQAPAAKVHCAAAATSKVPQVHLQWVGCWVFDGAVPQPAVLLLNGRHCCPAADAAGATLEGA